ncbi:hypothetical protein ACIRPK_32085 [Kitasatospora sp. NPDC101801]|uniref:hypothetical protein n=1 Tax=Kitasatospora sp. NPDC101801 TaxID=3364103 RepID=UPI00382719ED
MNASTSNVSYSESTTYYTSNDWNGGWSGDDRHQQGQWGHGHNDHGYYGHGLLGLGLIVL